MIFNLDKKINEAIDDALTFRPWWMAVEHDSYAHGSNAKHTIILQRVCEKCKEFLSYFLSRSFPSPHVCRTRPVMVVRNAGNTWGNNLVNFVSMSGRMPKATFVMFETITGNLTDGSMWASPQACPDRQNKWECIFLNTSNCVPPHFTACRSQQCIGMGEISYYSSGGPDGQRIPDDAVKSFVEAGRQIQAPAFEELRGDFKNAKFFHSLDPVLATDFNHSIESSSRSAIPIMHYIANFGMLQRFNSRFQILIDNEIRKFRESTSPHFSRTTECVALHIRLHDL